MLKYTMDDAVAPKSATVVVAGIKPIAWFLATTAAGHKPCHMPCGRRVSIVWKVGFWSTSFQLAHARLAEDLKLEA